MIQDTSLSRGKPYVIPLLVKLKLNKYVLPPERSSGIRRVLAEISMTRVVRLRTSVTLSNIAAGDYLICYQITDVIANLRSGGCDVLD